MGGEEDCVVMGNWVTAGFMTGIYLEDNSTLRGCVVSRNEVVGGGVGVNDTVSGILGFDNCVVVDSC